MIFHELPSTRHCRGLRGGAVRTSKGTTLRRSVTGALRPDADAVRRRAVLGVERAESTETRW